MGAEWQGETEEGRWPAWLKPLLRENFFGQCEFHAHSHKSECNMFCLDCIDRPLCSLCCLSHKDHHVIQIRRSSYHDVIRVSEIQKVLDITGVQTYIINSARVVFLNQRPQPRPVKGVTNTCLICHRSLLDTFSFCSLGCKIAGASREFQGGKKRVSSHPMTPASAVAPAGVFKQSYTSCGGATGGEKEKNMKAETHLSFSPSTPPATSVNYRTAKRRKGIPHRAPLGVLMA
uniref:PLATZ transcription factor family protein n=2 Tax=Kalanchoe fedtschenkoi TaxID=63787 RepID=A0A7N0UVP4_KALFE